MKFPFYLATRNLLRNPARNLLYILGISITAALLLDMILLSSGMGVSIERILKEMGYEIRVSPRGTLPFETDAQIPNFADLEKQIRRFPGVRLVDAMLGNTIAVDFQRESFTSFALGVSIHQPNTYRILTGSDIDPKSTDVLVNSFLAAEKGIQPGDTLKLRMPNQTQSAGRTDPVSVRVAGVAYFYLDAEGQFTILCPLTFLQTLAGTKQADPVSAILIKLEEQSNPAELVERINGSFPQLTAYTIASVIREVDRQLSYFKQFAYILGGISLVVTFVLVFIITTLSFHDRLGEVALLKGIGLSRKTIFYTIVLEGILTSLASAISGAILGKLVAVYLDRILTSAPGLPEDFSFFVFEPAAVLQGVIVLLMTGFFAGLYPAMAAIRLPVADTLREEIL